MSIPVRLALDLAASLVLSLVVLAVAVPIRPKILSIFAPLICGKGEKLRLTVTKASHHRTGEHGLVAESVGPQGTRSVMARLFFTAVVSVFLFFFLLGLIPVFTLGR